MTVKEKGEERPNTNFMQLRFLPFSDIFSKGYNFTTYIYDLNDQRTPEQKQNYKNQLIEFVRKALIPALKQGLNEFKFKGQLESPKALQTFEKENPGAVSYRPKAEVVKSWLGTNNTAELIKFVKTYPDAFDTAIDEFNSFMGSSVTTLLDDLFEKKKWDLLAQLLNASQKRALNIKKTSELAYDLNKTNVDKVKTVLEALKKHEVSEGFYDNFLFFLFTGSHKNHLSLYEKNADERNLSLSIVEKMLEDKTVSLRDIAGQAFTKNFIHLSVLNWLAATHQFTDWVSPKGLEIIFADNMGNIMPTENYSKQKAPVWYEDLEKFLNHCFQGIQAKKIDVSRIFTHDDYYYSLRDKLTPESFALLQGFHDKLKAENLAPNLVASLQSYFDLYKKN